MSDIKARTMDEAFYLQTKAFLEKNSEHIAEIARLKAEVERLTAEVSYENRVQLLVDKLAAEFTQVEVERLDALCKQLMKQHSDISCENIMLRKAGDAMAEWMDILGAPRAVPFIEAWSAAKEGKPSV